MHQLLFKIVFLLLLVKQVMHSDYFSFSLLLFPTLLFKSGE